MTHPRLKLAIPMVMLTAAWTMAGDMRAVLDPGGNFVVQSASSNVLMHVQSGGNVGIGTATPGSIKLNIGGANGGLTGGASTFALYGGTLGASAGNYLYPMEMQSIAGSNVRLQFSPYRRAAGASWLGTAYRVQYAVDNSFTDGSKAYLEIGAGDPGAASGGFISLGTEHADRLVVNSSGNVGIGTTTPQTPLDVAGTIRGLNFMAGAGSASVPAYYFGSAIGSTGMYAPEANVVGFATSGGERMRISANGFVGIGANPATKLHIRVDANKNILFRDSTGFGTGQSGVVLQSVNDALTGYEPLTVESSLVLLNPATRGSVGIGTVTPQATLDVNGTTRTKVLAITGGADVAEPFAIAGDAIPAGAVVVIDDENPGQLMVSERAYDTRVAGIVSGAGGVNPGLTLSQQDVLEGGRNVALTGRVYALADATDGAIRPGDLLTTSATRGHAMKVSDAAAAQGAILGKAMSRLDSGRGLVLILVTLQ